MEGSTNMPSKTHPRSSHRILMGTLCLFFSYGGGLSQGSLWQANFERGHQLRQQRHYQEAEHSYLAALAEAESFGPADPRLAQSLNALATVYYDTGQYSRAEALYQRALS